MRAIFSGVDYNIASGMLVAIFMIQFWSLVFQLCQNCFVVCLLLNFIYQVFLQLKFRFHCTNCHTLAHALLTIANEYCVALKYVVEMCMTQLST